MLETRKTILINDNASFTQVELTISRHADLRGHADVETECDNSHGSGPADLTCKQKGDAVEFVIDGPVGDHPGMGDGPHRGDL